MNRRRISPLALAAIIAICPASASGQQITVTVRDHAIPAHAIVDKGHVLLPLRETFESLNSSVWYDNNSSTITARNVLHTLRFKLGSAKARLDATTVLLEVPPRLVKGHVYVPLAFAAESMGAIIQYDATAKVVAVNGTYRRPEKVLAATEEAGGTVGSSNLRVPAAYHNVSPSSIRLASVPNAISLLIDSVDVTAQTVFDGPAIRYTAHDLTPGRHTFAIATRSRDGQMVTRQWGFIVAPPIGYPYYPYSYGYGGTNVPLGPTIIGPPTGSGFQSPSIALPFTLPFGVPYNRIIISNIGGSGLYLTGDPLYPLGQYPVSAPVLSPFIFPFRPFPWPVRPR